MHRSKITRKKFYNKWLYKITFNLPGFRIFDHKENVKTVFEDTIDIFELPPYGYFRESFRNREYLLDFYNFFKSYDKTSYARRVERNIVDIYTNDLDLFKKILFEFQDLVKAKYEPSPDLASLEALDKNMISAKKYPYGKYKFKVYLKPHKMRGDKESKIEWIKWVRLQQSKISLSDSTEKWFVNTDWNWDRRYMYVDNEKTLLLLKLRNSEVVGAVHEYYITNK